jgi:FMN reductase
MKLTVLVGIHNPKSRTLQTASAVADVITELVPGTRQVIDLADHAGRLFTWPDPEVDALTAAVAESDVLVVASPTYKAAYTGMLKAFLDRYQTNGLAGVVAVPVMTGAAPHHALAVETHLRPLLVELGAAVPTRGIYHLTSQMESLPTIAGDWGKVHESILRAVIPS